jgi:hypothetical protein
MAREKSIKIRLSEYEYQELQQEAQRQGIRMSDLLRKCIAKFPKPKGAVVAPPCFIRQKTARRQASCVNSKVAAVNFTAIEVTVAASAQAS